jgi:hypothetical protein
VEFDQVTVKVLGENLRLVLNKGSYHLEQVVEEHEKMESELDE